VKTFDVLGNKLVYESRWIRLREYQIARRGTIEVYSVVERQDSVIIIPISPSRKTVLLKQFRYPTQEDSWELPMGGINKSEKTEDAASRELLEETGLSAQRLVHLTTYYAVPGLSAQKVSVYVAEINEQDLLQLSPPKGVDDIQTYTITDLEQAYDMVSKGEITDGFTLVGFLYLRLFLKI
jgi:nudix-type nucleoside diphosphatase (YffH/AdpP family)